ncbi:MAG TPA: sulfatase-like hydrolase/transferase [Thermoanaerobaculia bacterium]|nr:sulfatase-like hydrolase/transferase [Thermoanaerobaculia bacterium]
MVLITLDALRADVLDPTLTPHLAALAGRAEWAGTAIASTSWTAPSMATLFTGLQPWSHGVLHPGRARVPDDLTTLAEAFAAAGFPTAAYRSNHWLEEGFGHAQGYGVFRRMGHGGGRAAGHLASLDGGPQFLWVHVLPPHAPYRNHAAFAARLGDDVPADLPKAVHPVELEPWYDPAVPLPAAERDRFWALYRSNVAWADHLLGELLTALDASGQRDETLLVVTADHGEEFGEHGQMAHGGNLGRRLVEVPLLVDLPRGFGGRLAVAETERPGLERLYATLVEAVGAEVPAVQGARSPAPGLWSQAARPVLSELYLGNGVNEYSLVDGDWQLLWRSRFAPAEDDYYRARLAMLGARPQPPPSEKPQVVFDRLEHAFDRARPLTGALGEPELRLVRWTAGGVEEVDDPRRRDAMARALRAAWRERNGDEVPPGRHRPEARQEMDEKAIEELRALGYVG